MNAYSFHEFREEQRALRKEALAKLREVEIGIRGWRRQYHVSCQKFIERLNATPRDVVYRYDRTRGTIITRIQQIKELRDFLARKGGGNRILSTGRLLGRAAVAQKVICGGNARSVSEFSQAAPRALLREALVVLESQQSELERALAAHDEAWNVLISAARSILQCIEELNRGGIVSPEDSAINALEGVLLYVFWEEVPRRCRKARRSNSLMHVESLRTLPFLEVLKQCLEGAARHISAGIPRAVDRERQRLLQSAAKRLVARLTARTEVGSFSRLEQAILALHFTFSSARQNLGGLVVHALRRYQNEIEESTDQEILHAIRFLVQEGVLRQSDLDVFRYTPSIWQAIERCQRRSDW